MYFTDRKHLLKVSMKSWDEGSQSYGQDMAEDILAPDTIDMERNDMGVWLTKDLDRIAEYVEDWDKGITEDDRLNDTPEEEIERRWGCTEWYVVDDATLF